MQTCGSREQDQLDLPHVSAGFFFDRKIGGEVVPWKVALFPDYTASKLRSLYVSSILADYRLSGLFPFRIN
jgi:hypothetical protein